MGPILPSAILSWKEWPLLADPQVYLMSLRWVMDRARAPTEVQSIVPHNIYMRVILIGDFWSV